MNAPVIRFISLQTLILLAAALEPAFVLAGPEKSPIEEVIVTGQRYSDPCLAMIASLGVV